MARELRRALVIGCSENVWEEVEAALRFDIPFDSVYCVKLAGVHWKGGKFIWATLHPEFMNDYEEQRRASGGHHHYEIVAPLPSEVGMHGKKGNIDRRVSYRYPGMNSSASSGGYAAKIALEDGHDRVVLAGVPMIADRKHFTRGKTWEQRDSFVRGFKDSLPYFTGKVKSMSGWTADVLGSPDPEWLNGVTP